MVEIRILGLFFWIGLAILIFAAVTFVVAVYGQEGTGYGYISQQLLSKDKFNITEIYPTVRDGREWFSKWDNNSRAFGNEIDPYDLEFSTEYGDGYYTIDADKGVMTVTGPTPRMYVFDNDRFNTWHNVEITFYGKRVSETEQVDWAGLQAYGRTAHVDDYDPCSFRGYGGQMLYNGFMLFEKEVQHHEEAGYVQRADIRPWPNEGDMPKDEWIGYKFVIYNQNEDEVKLELYRDMTDGLNGGRWEKMTEFVDDGNWGEDAPSCSEDIEPEEVLLEPALSVYIRNDGIEEADYKKFSVREISSPE